MKAIVVVAKAAGTAGVTTEAPSRRQRSTTHRSDSRVRVRLDGAGGALDLDRRNAILAAIEHGLSNGLVESVNTRIRRITRSAFGFALPDALITLAMLPLGRTPPTLLGRH